MKNKHIYFTTAALFITAALTGQSHYTPPEPITESCAKDYVFIANEGQLRTSEGEPADGVKYFLQSNSPNLFFQDGKVSFAHLDRTDSNEFAWYRLDMEFICDDEGGAGESGEDPGCAPPVQAFQKTGSVNNYFLPHTGSSGITGVENFQRIIYEDAFPEIDFHFYSNRFGPKTAVVIHEHADPSQIKLRFTGQDSLVNLNGILRAHLEAWELDVPDMLAYEVDPSGNITPKMWTAQLVHNGNGIVSIQLGSYDPGHKLVLLAATPEPANMYSRAPKNNEWSTYIGGFAEFDQISSVTTDDTNSMYLCGKTGSPDFPITAGQDVIDDDHEYWTDAIVSKFNPEGELKWTNFFGGSYDEEAVALELDSEGNVVFVVRAFSADLPLKCSGGGRYCQSFVGDPWEHISDVYIAKITNGGDSLIYASYYGDEDDDVPCYQCLHLDSNDNIYFAGSTEDDFPTYATGSAFLQTNPGADNGFVVKLNSSGVRQWATLLGGGSSDHLTALTGNSDGTIFAGGSTWSQPGNNLCGVPSNNGFPLCDVNGSSDYYQDQKAGAFLTEFNASGELIWSTFFGSPANSNQGYIYSLEYTADDYLYFVGLADTSEIDQSDCAPPTSNGTPLCERSGAYMDSTVSGVSDLIIGRFNPQRGYDWGTLYGGGTGGEVSYDIELSPEGHVYITGWSNSFDFPHEFKFGFYYQDSKADAAESRTDAFIIGFDSAGAYRWGTYYGGSFTNNEVYEHWRMEESAYGLALDSQDKLYMVGATPSSLFPYACDPNVQYCRSTPMTFADDLDDGFIVRFSTDELLGIKESFTEMKTLELYPNPTDREIWVKLPDGMNQNRQLSVMSIDGHLVHQKRLTDRKQNIKLDMSFLPPGIYVISIMTDGNKTLSAKLVKH